MALYGRSVLLVTCEYLPFPGGIATYSSQLAKAVTDEGHHVVVVCPRYEEADLFLETDLKLHRLLGHHGIPVIAIPRLLSLLRNAPADTLILAADIRSLLLLHILRPLHHRQFRVMVHGSEASKFRPGSLLFRLVQRAYLQTELVLYNSQATQRIFHEGIGRPARECVSYLGVDSHWFTAETGGFEHNELAVLSPEGPVFCTVGRVEARKGQLQAIKCLAHARDRFGLADPVYVIAGRPEDISYTKAVRAVADRHAVKILITGRLSTADLKRLYCRARANLLLAQPLPGKIEGFGLVLLEAAAQRCPSIATNIGGITEVVAGSGALFSPDDLDGIAMAIRAYAEDPALRTRQGDAAYDRARLFSWHACAAASFPELALEH